METTPESTVIEEQKKAPKAKKAKSNLPLIILVVLLLAAGSGAYWWRDKEAKNQAKKSRAEIALLKDKISTLEAEANQPVATEETAPAVPTAAVKENIIASIKSGNTAALEGYMASTVRVIIAASEGVGDRTPTEAIADLEYLDSATDPWNFALPAATLSSWGSGSYSQYFPSNAVVGKSANDYVVSFTFNSAGKINGIFLSVNADLL